MRPILALAVLLVGCGSPTPTSPAPTIQDASEERAPISEPKPAPAPTLTPSATEEPLPASSITYEPVDPASPPSASPEAAGGKLSDEERRDLMEKLAVERRVEFAESFKRVLPPMGIEAEEVSASGDRSDALHVQMADGCTREIVQKLGKSIAPLLRKLGFSKVTCAGGAREFGYDL